ncbi:MAG: FAD-binding oxidoreductase [Pseudomonadota bacterium]
MTLACDFLVIGAGLPGLSLAAELASEGRVIVAEREEHPGYHATGRSAAIFSGSYGLPPVQALSALSRPLLEAFPTEDGVRSSLTARGIFFVAFEGDRRRTVDHMAPLPKVSPTDLCRAVPILRPDMVLDVRHEADAADIDVHAVQSGYLRLLRERGGRLMSGAAVGAARRDHGVWRVDLPHATIEARTVIDSAGAWAGQVAALFGAADPGLAPLRRSAAIVDGPQDMAVSGWPMIVNADETLYFKPEGGRLMLSPADETPVEPHDAYAEDMDIAIAVDRFMQITTLEVRQVRTPWAGLRTFAPDRLPMIGFDPMVEGFFWLAGQGGFGIQTAPGAARLAAALLTGHQPDEALRALAGPLSPGRFRR